MIIRCPACGFVGRIPEGKGGRDRKRVICPSCGHRFSVGLVVLPHDNHPSELPVSTPRANGNTTAGTDAGVAGTVRSAGGGTKKWRHPFLWGCLITVAAVAAGIAAYILVSGISRHTQESKEYDILKKLGEKHPGYLLLNSIAADPGSMTELQISSYEKSLVGKGCVGMGTVMNVEKTVGSAVLDFFGMTAPGTIIALTYRGYDIELVLDESYSDEFLTYGVGDTVLFAGIIKKAVVARGTRLTLVDVVIEGHTKGKAGLPPPEAKKSLSKRLLELLLE